MLLKLGKRDMVQNLRLVTLLCILMKGYERFLCQRVNFQIQEDDLQGWHTEGKGTIDRVLILYAVF